MTATTLTEKQAEVMELVARGYSSKAIAKALRLSPYTVDQRIHGARRKLGGDDRFEAARRFLALQGIPERTIYEPLDIPPDDQTASPPGGPHDDLRFQEAAFDDRAIWDRRSAWHLPDFKPEDLGNASRLLVVLALAILILATLGALSNFASSLDWVSPPG